MEKKTRREVWEAMPGEFVTGYRYPADANEPGGEPAWGWEWCVKRVPQLDGPPSYEASLPFRQVAWCSSTPEGAIGSMVRGMCELARKGSIDPSAPYLPGSPVIQHVIHVLSERLLYQVERRREHVNASEQPTNGPDQAERLLQAVARDNEVIAALATSVAALARVRDL